MSFEFSAILAGLPPPFRGAQNRFQEGGSVGQSLLMVLLIVAIALLAVWLGILLSRRERKQSATNAQRVFKDTLERLKLSDRQRQFLRTLARELKLDNPNTILLSPSVFDRHVKEYRSQLEKAGKIDSKISALAVAAQVRAMLFSQSGPKVPTTRTHAIR